MRRLWMLIRDHGGILLGVLFLALLPFTGQYQFYILERGLQNAMHVLGLVILVGYTGLLSLGHAGFLATGAYTYAILIAKLGLSPWVAFVVAPAFTALIGAVLAFPSFRLSGPFLVVVTIAFGEIVRVLVLNLKDFTGGPYGLYGFGKLIPNSLTLYYVMVSILLALAIGTRRLGNSRIGLAFKAIRDDEVAAEVMGVDVRRCKLLSFVLCAFVAGLSGVFFANLTGYLNPDSFTFTESSAYLLMVVMGGLQNVTGAIISSVVVTSLPEVLRFMARSRLLIYSLVLLTYLRFYGKKSGLSQILRIRQKPGATSASTNTNFGR